jgi:hypothetical protein
MIPYPSAIPLLESNREGFMDTLLPWNPAMTGRHLGAGNFNILLDSRFRWKGETGFAATF